MSKPQTITLNFKTSEARNAVQAGAIDYDTLQTALGEGSHPVAYRLANMCPDALASYMQAIKTGAEHHKRDAVAEIARKLQGEDKVSPYYLEYALDKIEAIVEGVVSSRFKYPNIFGTERIDREFSEAQRQAIVDLIEASRAAQKAKTAKHAQVEAEAPAEKAEPVIA